MPNHVTNKIMFPSGRAEEVFQKTCPDGKFDFNTLIPTPASVYQGDLGSEEEKDFAANWHEWNRANWGTKWNCYQQSSGVIGEHGYIMFDTAWSVPYPVIAAFANTFKIEFEHSYFDEGHCFWGVENWSVRNGVATRISKDRNNPHNKRTLCMDLKDYDPDQEESDE